MAENQSLQLAKHYYELLCETLDSAELKYRRDDENLAIVSGMRGEDIPVECVVAADADHDMMLYLSKLPFTIAEDKRLEVAVALCAVNDAMRDGAFQFDINDGTIIFRLTANYLGNPLTREDMLYLFILGARVVDAYNDKLLMLSKGMLSLEKFIESI